jgi:cation diffusion facilitator CzcD-associated flavoprotein CzcO
MGSTPKMLDVPGIDNFKRQLVHTGAWPKDIDLRGKTVAVIGGAGASGIQLIPAIQPLVKKLVVYQRSKFWGVKGERSKFVGKAKQNFQYSEEQIRHFTEHPELAAQYQRDVETELGFLHEAVSRADPIIAEDIS